MVTPPPSIGPFRPPTAGVPRPGSRNGPILHAVADITGPSGPGAVIQITPWFQYQNQAGLNVLDYVCVNQSPQGPAWRDIAAAWVTANRMNYLAGMTTDTAFEIIGMKELFPVKTNQIWVAVTQTPGTVPPPVGPAQVCGLIRKIGQGAGRGTRGRAYIPFVPLALLKDAFSLLPAYVTVLETIAGGLSGGLVVNAAGTTGTYVLCLYNRKTNGIRNVVGLQASTGPATQRRRGAFGRPNVIPAPNV